MRKRARSATISNNLEIKESLLDYNFGNTLVVLYRRLGRFDLPRENLPAASCRVILTYCVVK